jgi:hypothetical protein
MIRRLVVIIAVAFVLSSCGDPGYVVYVFNRTSQSVVVTVEGNADAPSRPRDIEPGASVSMTWLYPTNSSDTRRTVVRAMTRDGKLVFCRRYSFDEVRADLRWEVNIIPGTLSC